MAITRLRYPQRLHRDLRIIGSDLSEVMLLGGLLGAGFACVSLVHTLDPLKRANDANRALIDVVLLDQAASADDLRAVAEQDALVVFLCDLSNPAVAAVEASGGIVLPRNSTAALEALVTSLTTQLSLSEVL